MGCRTRRNEGKGFPQMGVDAAGKDTKGNERSDEKNYDSTVVHGYSDRDSRGTVIVLV